MAAAYSADALEIDAVTRQPARTLIENTHINALVDVPENPNGVGVVLASSIWGLNCDLQSYMTFLSSFGFSVIAPNLFWRVSQDHAIDYDFSRMSFLEHLNEVGSDAEGVSDVLHARSALLARAPVHSMAIIGWCYGGRIACKAGVNDDFEAVVGVYPTYLEQHLDLSDAISCKLLLHLPEQEQWKTTEDCTAEIISAFSPKPNVNLHVYPGVSHGFDFAPPHPNFDFSAARLCDARTLTFLLDVAAGGRGVRS